MFLRERKREGKRGRQRGREREREREKEGKGEGESDRVLFVHFPKSSVSSDIGTWSLKWW